MQTKRCIKLATVAFAIVLISQTATAAPGPLDQTAPSPGTSPTSVSLKNSTSKAVYKSRVTFRSRLSSFGEPLKKKQVYFFMQASGASWRQIAHAKTGSSGEAVFRVRPIEEALYAVAYLPQGSDLGKYSQSESNDIRLMVSPSIGVSLGQAAHGAVPGQRIRIRGVIKPDGSIVKARVRVFRNGRKIKVRKVDVRKSRFNYSFKANRSGKYRVSASTDTATGLAAGRSRARAFRAVYPRLGPGSRGFAVRLLQRRLKRLHYWVSVTGRYDGATSRAVLAFRKVTGMARTVDASRTLWKKIGRGGGSFKLRRKRKGRYIEADLSRQVIALARNGKVHRIIHTSSGASGTPTVQGTFTFYMRQAGYNAKRMYYSIYFIRGYAIHGFDPVPTYPASHGCLRIPESNAVAVFNWIRNGDKISVYS